MRDEIVGIGAPEHENPDAFVSFGVLNQAYQIAHHADAEQVHRGCGYLHEKNRTVAAHFERLERHR
ncbi:hypothetical protein D3C72_1832700 [compost metagenome]